MGSARTAIRWHVGATLMLSASLSTLAHAQAPDSQLSEQEVVQAILQADPILAQQQAKIANARAQIALSSARWNPTAYYELEQVGAKDRLEREQELGAGATLPSPNQQASRDQARVQAALTRFGASRTVHQRVLAGVRRFYRILAIRAQIEILHAWQTRLAQLAKVVRARVKAGQAPGYEQLRMDLAQLNIATRLRTQEALRDAETRSFANYLGLDAKAVQFRGELLPSQAKVATSYRALKPRDSLKELQHAQTLAKQSHRRMLRAWLPSLSINGGLRMRRTGDLRDWGFGMGLGATFPTRARVIAVKRAASSSLKASSAKLAFHRFQDRQRAHRAAALCLALLAERTRYVQELHEILRPLETAVQAEYKEGKRDVIGLMTVLENSLQSDRYAVELAEQARSAEIDLRDAQGVFEK